MGFVLFLAALPQLGTVKNCCAAILPVWFSVLEIHWWSSRHSKTFFTQWWMRTAGGQSPVAALAWGGWGGRGWIKGIKGVSTRRFQRAAMMCEAFCLFTHAFTFSPLLFLLHGSWNTMTAPLPGLAHRNVFAALALTSFPFNPPSHTSALHPPSPCPPSLKRLARTKWKVRRSKKGLVARTRTPAAG